MRRTKADAAVTREHLLDAAQACFLARGYSEANLEDVAKAAGTTRGAIQWHFGSKAELFNALVRDRYERAAVNMQRAIDPSLGPLEALRKMMVWWIGYPEEDADFCAILQLGSVGREVWPELSDGIKEKINGIQASIGAFAWLVRKGIAAGEVRPEVQPTAAARAALGYIYGIFTLWMIDPAAFSLKATAEESVDLFLKGIV